MSVTRENCPAGQESHTMSVVSVPARALAVVFWPFSWSTPWPAGHAAVHSAQAVVDTGENQPEGHAVQVVALVAFSVSV